MKKDVKKVATGVFDPPYPQEMWSDELKYIHKETVENFNRFLKGLPRNTQMSFFSAKKMLKKENEE